MASGLITTSQQIGGGIGLTILTSVSTMNHLLASAVAAPTALTDGSMLAFWVAALAFVATLVLLRPGKPAVSVEPAELRRAADDRQVPA